MIDWFKPRRKLQIEPCDGKRLDLKHSPMTFNKYVRMNEAWEE